MKVTIQDIHAAARASTCPVCDGEMQARFRQTDGGPFLGCGKFPKCKGRRPLNVVIHYDLIEVEAATVSPDRLLADCKAKV